MGGKPLPGGEVCSGHWAPLRPDDPSAGQAVLAGDKGTTLTVEFSALNPARMSDVKGVAVDNNGNLFKLTF
jgi:hypothetical protein